MQNGQDKVTELWEMYQQGVLYQTASHLRDNVPRFIDFYEGKQWSSVIPKGTESMPRCQFNIIKPICRNKKANILSVPYKLNYSSLNNEELSIKFTRFAEYQQKAMGIDDIDSDAIDKGIKAGTYIYHYYWDKDACNVKQGVKKGAVKCELLDMMDVFFANPRETDEQRQQYILIRSRVNVDSLKETADKDVDQDLIVHDIDDDNIYNSEEQEGSNLCTLLTRYFRIKGEVYCERATKSTIINKPYSLTPTESFAPLTESLEGDDNAEIPLFDSPSKRQNKATLYPIVVGQYEERTNSIYGLSEVEGIIPNQQAINQLGSMQTYNVLMNSWGKWKVSPKALQGQKINNDAGQVLTDYDPAGNGISRIESGGFSSAPVVILKEVISLTRNACGSNEVTNGEVLGANMSGSAIAQLQAQASLPTEELRNRFWRTKKKCGKVLAQFFILFYDEEEFSYVEKGDQTQEVKTDVFIANDYKNIDFDIQVEATGGTRASSASDIQFLETLFKAGAIDAPTFAQLYPNEAIANKSDVLRAIKNMQTNENIQLKQQLATYEQQLQQSAELLQKQNKVIDNASSIIQENNSLKAELFGLFRESNDKIQMANEAISKYGATKEEADDFADYILKSNGYVKKPQGQEEMQTNNEISQ